MPKFRGYLEFHVDKMSAIEQVTIVVDAIDHETAFSTILTVKNEILPELKLKNINLFETR